ncbi:MAG: hypothetical protein JWM80_1370 [Cyanobacteria bacterium RYN_339]|nr:hypothetical protein [Cyanobacteria bacterium RYN_339]
MALSLAWPVTASAEAAQPLVLAPSVEQPSPAGLALDLAMPTLVSAAAFYAIIGGGIDSPSVQALLIGGALAAPPAALVAFREKPFALDSYFAAASGGVLGMLLGMGLSRVFLPTDAGLVRLPLLAIGQGLGAAAGYHLYRLAKPNLEGLDKLPEHRTDDPNNWDRWKERHHP